MPPNSGKLDNYDDSGSVMVAIIKKYKQQIVILRCQFLLIAHEESLKRKEKAVIHKRASLKDRCNVAVPTMMRTYVHMWTHLQALMKWHIIFCNKGNTFLHHNLHANDSKRPDPLFFWEFPEAKLSLMKKADESLACHELSVGNLLEYVNNVIIRRLWREHNEGLDQQNKITRYGFLCSLGFLHATKRNKTTNGHSNNDGLDNDTDDDSENEDEDSTISKKTICK